MAGAALDMTLDDLIKTNKKSAPRGRGTRGGAAGPARRQFNRAPNRPAPYAAPFAAPKAPDAVWGHDLFPAVGRPSSIETGTKLYISNLDYGVSNEDIKELFAEVGDLKRFSVHYDRIGRSKGTAEVVFSRRPDALAAIKKYNNVQLDGKPMQIELVGTNLSTSTGVAPGLGIFADVNVAPPRYVVLNNGFMRGRGGRGRGRGRGGGRGWGRGRGRGENVSAEDLDADLEKYHANSMQTN
ncbi:hypothetical protein M569_11800 [Genlisea aurea]|uniref:RRM domain-containing protein n=1 Tax=Genlisea aurea TaxID=192259 RepID=S8C882_9LAMI|nr:hypothetical protein M569_11800 [Genlisea aurea]